MKSLLALSWCGLMRSVPQPVPLLEHDGLCLAMKILWANGFYKHINLSKNQQSLDRIIVLSGAAIWSAIQKYETGTNKCVEFSVAKSKDTSTFKDIFQTRLSPHIELARHLSSLKAKMKELHQWQAHIIEP